MQKFQIYVGLINLYILDEYLRGGNNLPIVPVCLSLLTTFISGLF